MSQVAIIETDVYGVLAYHAQCLTCGLRVCDHGAHDREESAVRHASVHTCESKVAQSS